MAVAFGSTASVAGGATVNVPSGTANGDGLVMHVTSFTVADVPACTGWTQGTGSPKATSAEKDAWFYRIAASEPASYTITGVTATSTIASILRFTGTDGTTLVNVGDEQANTTTSTNAPTPSITPSVANCMLVGLWSCNGPVITAPGTMTQANSLDGGDFMDAYELLSGGSGSAVSRTATLSATSISNGVLAALQPPSGAVASIPNHIYQKNQAVQRAAVY
ncbi:MAG: hypothetical protein NVS2B16_25630 [Chloroflexota bacterium]